MSPARDPAELTGGLDPAGGLQRLEQARRPRHRCAEPAGEVGRPGRAVGGEVAADQPGQRWLLGLGRQARRPAVRGGVGDLAGLVRAEAERAPVGGGGRETACRQRGQSSWNAGMQRSTAQGPTRPRPAPRSARRWSGRRPRGTVPMPATISSSSCPGASRTGPGRRTAAGGGTAVRAPVHRPRSRVGQQVHGPARPEGLDQLPGVPQRRLARPAGSRRPAAARRRARPRSSPGREHRT